MNAGVIGRLLWGRLSDRCRSMHFPLSTFLMAAGAVASSRVLAAGDSRSLPLVSILIAIAWPSRLPLAVGQPSPQAPVAASAIIGAGQYGGGIIGPFTSGLIFEAASYRAARSATAGAAAVSALRVAP